MQRRYTKAIFLPLKDRLQYFGEEDHVRIYQVGGLKNRLSQSGFEVKVNPYINKDIIYGLTKNENSLIIKKQA